MLSGSESESEIQLLKLSNEYHTQSENCDISLSQKCDKNNHNNQNIECENVFFVAVDGQWADWSEWTTCSLTCGGGYKTRFRYCDDPLPEGTGKDCDGEDMQNFTCNFLDCPSE